MVKPPSYITKNRLGIYSFQVRLPTAVTRYNPHLKYLLRFTLETRDKATALRLARRKIVVLDSIRLLFKGDSKSTARAVELWIEYEKSIGTRFGWAAVDEFLSELDDGDRHLLEAILSCQSGLDSQKAFVDENAVLKKLYQWLVLLVELLLKMAMTLRLEMHEKSLSVQNNRMIRLGLRLLLMGLLPSSL